ncbi:MAG: hypothetical protein U9Q69_00020 [Nanoarchaeota archaeon]|nr:hypothetical protein [Nanoarchaeota archaeon]
MGYRGLIKDIIILIIGFLIIKSWLFHEPISWQIGIGTIILMLIAIKFLLERFKF